MTTIERLRTYSAIITPRTIDWPLLHKAADELQSLTDRVKELEKQNSALLEYASHAPTCPMPVNKCDCGLEDLLKEQQ